MNPAPPVTSTRIGRGSSAGQDGLAPDGVVLEAETPHALRLVEVAGVEDQRRRSRPRSRSRFRYLNSFHSVSERHPVGSRGRLVGRLAEDHAGRHHRAARSPSPPGRRRGPGRPPRGAPDHLEALGLAHVVGVGLERQAQHRDRLVLERAQRLARSSRPGGAARSRLISTTERSSLKS